jgi:3-methyladenine DNA glycosylase AlkD
MTANEVLDEIQPLGRDGYRRILRNHGVPAPCFGVKIEDLKKIQRRVKKDYQLALDLYDTGVYDAMYLAGLIADDMKMAKKDLRHWIKNAHCPALCEYAVPWVAAGSRHGLELAREWIESEKGGVAMAGWATLSCLMAFKDDAELVVTELKQLLDRVRRKVHQAPNRVRYSMNSFAIAVGSYVKALTDHAIQTAEKIGDVNVNMGNTSCKVPDAAEYIRKVQNRGTIGKKRKSVKC